MQQKQRAVLEQRQRKQAWLGASSKRIPSSILPSRRLRSRSSSDDDGDGAPRPSSRPSAAPVSAFAEASVDSELDHLRAAWSDACAATDDAEDAARPTADRVAPSVRSALQNGSWLSLPSQFVSTRRIDAMPSSLPGAGGPASNVNRAQAASDQDDFEQKDAGEAPSPNSEPDSDAELGDEMPPTPPPQQLKHGVRDTGGLAPMDIDTG